MSGAGVVRGVPRTGVAVARGVGVALAAGRGLACVRALGAGVGVARGLALSRGRGVADGVGCASPFGVRLKRSAPGMKKRSGWLPFWAIAGSAAISSAPAIGQARRR